MLRLCPNKKMKRMLMKGTEKLKDETNIVTLIRRLRNATIQLKQMEGNKQCHKHHEI